MHHLFQIEGTSKVICIPQGWWFLAFFKHFWPPRLIAARQHGSKNTQSPVLLEHGVFTSHPTPYRRRLMSEPENKKVAIANVKSSKTRARELRFPFLLICERNLLLVMRHYRNIFWGNWFPSLFMQRTQGEEKGGGCSLHFVFLNVSLPLTNFRQWIPGLTWGVLIKG